MKFPTDPDLPTRGAAVSSLTLLFAVVFLVALALHRPAPLDDLMGWALRAAGSLAAGGALAALVWRWAAYPPRPGG